MHDTNFEVITIKNMIHESQSNHQIERQQKKKVSTIMYTCMSWVLTTSDYELLIIIGLFLVNLNYVHKVIGWGYDLCENCVHLIQFGDKSINWFPTKLVKISW